MEKAKIEELFIKGKKYKNIKEYYKDEEKRSKKMKTKKTSKRSKLGRGGLSVSSKQGIKGLIELW